jgi:hypothetical protein
VRVCKFRRHVRNPRARAVSGQRWQPAAAGSGSHTPRCVRAQGPVFRRGGRGSRLAQICRGKRCPRSRIHVSSGRRKRRSRRWRRSPHNGFELTEEAVRAGARLVRDVHDLTSGTRFAAGSEVAAHRNLSQPNFIFRDMIPIAIIDWDVARPGTRVENLGRVPLGVRPSRRLRRRRAGRTDAVGGGRRVRLHRERTRRGDARAGPALRPR